MENLENENTDVEAEVVEVVEKGAITVAIEGFITLLTGSLELAVEYDKNDFEKKSGLTKCSSELRKDVQTVKKAIGELYKEINETTKSRATSFDGTPEEQIAKQKDRVAKMLEDIKKAEEKLSA